MTRLVLLLLATTAAVLLVAADHIAPLGNPVYVRGIAGSRGVRAQLPRHAGAVVAAADDAGSSVPTPRADVPETNGDVSGRDEPAATPQENSRDHSVSALALLHTVVGRHTAFWSDSAETAGAALGCLDLPSAECPTNAVVRRKRTAADDARAQSNNQVEFNGEYRAEREAARPFSPVYTTRSEHRSAVFETSSVADWRATFDENDIQLGAAPERPDVFAPAFEAHSTHRAAAGANDVRAFVDTTTFEHSRAANRYAAVPRDSDGVDAATVAAADTLPDATQLPYGTVWLLNSGYNASDLQSGPRYWRVVGATVRCWNGVWGGAAENNRYVLDDNARATTTTTNSNGEFTVPSRTFGDVADETSQYHCTATLPRVLVAADYGETYSASWLWAHDDTLVIGSTTCALRNARMSIDIGEHNGNERCAREPSGAVATPETGDDYWGARAADDGADSGPQDEPSMAPVSGAAWLSGAQARVGIDERIGCRSTFEGTFAHATWELFSAYGDESAANAFFNESLPLAVDTGDVERTSDDAAFIVPDFIDRAQQLSFDGVALASHAADADGDVQPMINATAGDEDVNYRYASFLGRTVHWTLVEHGRTEFSLTAELNAAAMASSAGSVGTFVDFDVVDYETVFPTPAGYAPPSDALPFDVSIAAVSIDNAANTRERAVWVTVSQEADCGSGARRRKRQLQRDGSVSYTYLSLSGASASIYGAGPTAGDAPNVATLKIANQRRTSAAPRARVAVAFFTESEWSSVSDVSVATHPFVPTMIKTLSAAGWFVCAGDSRLHQPAKPVVGAPFVVLSNADGEQLAVVEEVFPLNLPRVDDAAERCEDVFLQPPKNVLSAFDRGLTEDDGGGSVPVAEPVRDAVAPWAIAGTSVVLTEDHVVCAADVERVDGSEYAVLVSSLSSYEVDRVDDELTFAGWWSPAMLVDTECGELCAQATLLTFTTVASSVSIADSYAFDAAVFAADFGARFGIPHLYVLSVRAQHPAPLSEQPRQADDAADLPLPAQRVDLVLAAALPDGFTTDVDATARLEAALAGNAWVVGEGAHTVRPWLDENGSRAAPRVRQNSGSPAARDARVWLFAVRATPDVALSYDIVVQSLDAKLLRFGEPRVLHTVTGDHAPRALRVRRTDGNGFLVGYSVEADAAAADAGSDSDDSDASAAVVNVYWLRLTSSWTVKSNTLVGCARDHDEWSFDIVGTRAVLVLQPGDITSDASTTTTTTTTTTSGDAVTVDVCADECDVSAVGPLPLARLVRQLWPNVLETALYALSYDSLTALLARSFNRGAVSADRMAVQPHVDNSTFTHNGDEATVGAAPFEWNAVYVLDCSSDDDVSCDLGADLDALPATAQHVDWAAADDGVVVNTAHPRVLSYTTMTRDSTWTFVADLAPYNVLSLRSAAPYVDPSTSTTPSATAYTLQSTVGDGDCENTHAAEVLASTYNADTTFAERAPGFTYYVHSLSPIDVNLTHVDAPSDFDSNDKNVFLTVRAHDEPTRVVIVATLGRQMLYGSRSAAATDALFDTAPLSTAAVNDVCGTLKALMRGDNNCDQYCSCASSCTAAVDDTPPYVYEMQYFRVPAASEDASTGVDVDTHADAAEWPMQRDTPRNYDRFFIDAFDMADARAPPRHGFGLETSNYYPGDFATPTQPSLLSDAEKGDACAAQHVRNGLTGELGDC